MQTPFSFLRTVTFVHLKTAHSFLVVLLLGWAKGLQHYQLIALLGWPLLTRGNSAAKFQGLAVLSLQDSPLATPMKVLGDVTAKILPNGQEVFDAPTRARTQRLTSKRVSRDHFSRTRFQCFSSNPPHSSYKKLIILTPRLVQALRTMSIAKAVPKGIKDRECERFALQECPPVPYVPEKDPV